MVYSRLPRMRLHVPDFAGLLCRKLVIQYNVTSLGSGTVGACAYMGSSLCDVASEA
jgi:hypothetical protein